MSCISCGAPLKNNEKYCPYCGSQNPMYSKSEYGAKVTVECVQPGTKKFIASCRLPDCVFRHNDKDEAMRIVKRQLASNLATKIIDELPIYMNDMQFDPRDLTVIFEVPVQIYDRHWL